MDRLMTLLCLIVGLLSPPLWAEAPFRLGIPKQHSAPIYDQIAIELRKRGYIEGENLTTIAFDLNNTTAEAIEAGVDIFYSSGDRITQLYEIQPQVPILFLTMQGSYAIPKEMQERVTGVYRTAHLKKAFDDMSRIVEGVTRAVLIYNDSSGLTQHTQQYLQAAEEIKLNMAVETYRDAADLERLMAQIATHYEVVFLFPPSVPTPLIPLLVELQHRYRIPVITQVATHVEMGLVAGYTTNYQQIAVQLVDYMESMLNGRAAKDLPLSYFSADNWVNLRAADALQIKLNPEFVESSHIIGIASQPLETALAAEAAAPLIEGHYRVALANRSPQWLVDAYLQQMAQSGYRIKENLTLDYFDEIETVTADLILLTGNVLEGMLPDLGSQPAVGVTLYSPATKGEEDEKAIVYLYRSSFKALAEFIHSVKPETKRVVGIIHADEALASRLDCIESRQLFQAQQMALEIVHYQHDIDPLLEQLTQRVDLLLLFPSSLPRADIQKLVAWQWQHRTPVVAQTRHDVEQGLLYGVVPDLQRMMDILVEMSNAILLKKIPPQQLNNRYLKADYLINLESAQRMGVKLPDTVSEKLHIIINQ
ncbi:hypothetical protein D5085_16375 [Ectothiorhodospiraceae bacterium BW-2]|nr:hypothetical protein D5085_16375 [Ectothiorhodospiraceae bacterium BW-2]